MFSEYVGQLWCSLGILTRRLMCLCVCVCLSATPLVLLPQAGFKYWLVLCIVFEVLLVVLYAVPVVRPLNPAFGFVAASLSMSERVEATVSKVRTAACGVYGGEFRGLCSWSLLPTLTAVMQ